MEDLKTYIRDIPNFPKEGITFHDITPLLQNAKAFEAAVGEMAKILEIGSMLMIIVKHYLRCFLREKKENHIIFQHQMNYQI